MNYFIKGLLLLTILSTHSYASCNKGATIFSCTTKKGKQIEVCDNKTTIEYSFGKLNSKPELLINVPRKNVTTTQWAGMGSYVSYSVDIPNNNTVYNIFWGMDRMNENHPIEAGVNVFINKNLAATVYCSDKIENNIKGVDLAPSNE